MLKEEIIKIVRRKQFKIVFFILFFSAILDFLVTCKNYYGIELSWVRSAYECTLLKNNVKMFTRQFFTTLFPLVVSIIASDIYYEEYSLGINNFIFTRVSKIRNVRTKIFSIVIVVFFTVCIPLLVNFALTLTAFPIQGYYAKNTSYLTLTIRQSDRILSYMEIYHPYLNILIYIIIRSILGVTMALVSFSISLIHKFNRYIILFSGMIFYFLYSNLVSLSNSEILNTDIFGINNYGSIWMIVVYILISLAFSFVFVIIGCKKENI